MSLKERIENDFVYHKPKENQANRYEEIRDMGRNVARFLLEKCPEGREISIALTKLDEAVFWANAAIARNE